ncbi:MAG: dockerin type I domain-containing protein [Pirellulales bacterium]
MTIEPFEQRVLLAIDGPVLLAVIPSTGIVVEQGTVLGEAPRQLLFRFDSAIDASSLVTNNVPTAIQFKRGGNHVLGDGNDVTVTPGFIGLGENSIDVIVRFDQNLPDDLYQMTVVGAGSNPLRDTAGLPFNAGENLDRTFSLDLGAQVVAVVPQPITRDTTTHKLNQPATNKIEVYFNVNDPLDQNSAQNVSFYQLIRTGGTATTQDDNLPNHQPINPILVEYSQSTGKAILTFANGVLEMPGTYRLRIGTSEPLALPPTVLSPGAAGTDFAHAASLGPGGNPFPADLGTQTIEVHDVIMSVSTEVLFPGSPLEPGERDTDIEAHVFGGSNNGNIPVFSYNFKAEYGTVLGQPVFNLITPTQKERIREVLSYFSQYVGVEFVETSDAGFIIVTGDVRAVNPNAPPTGIGGIAGGGVAIMNALIDWGASEQGGSYFKTAMHEIGHLLGLGHNYEAPPLTIMGSGAESALGSTSGGEPVFPGDLDILYGRYVWPALGNDINVYRFNLSDAGRINIETFAERLRSLNLAAAPSQLDSVISIYDSTGALIARNDDYYGKDSFVQLQLTAGTYYVAITSTGNTNFDPRVVNSGFGGTTQGAYELRLTFTPTPGANDGIRYQTGTRLDGDRDGLEGGVSNFWFKVNLAQTLYVDKASTGGTGALGTYTNPYTTISQALAAATTGFIVRIVGNPGADNVPATLTDNLSYNVGFNSLGQALSDGSTFNVPRGVTVMIDAGAIIKLRAANVDVGSSAQGIERGAGALQVLGTPAKDASGRDIGSVFFTSYYNNTIGFDTGTAKGPLTKGNWGGLVFRNDSDLESAGIFLNYVNRANLSWGGGQVSVNSVLAVYDPIHLETSRPTITYNVITSSADSAISADPNSFEETEFLGADYHAEYSRVGPRVYGNTLTQNSINGLFIRVRTLNGRPLDPLTLNARLANTDVVHVLNEVLLINGEAGGFIRDVNTGLHARPSARLAIDPGLVLKMGGARIETEFGAQFIAEGTVDRPVIFTSAFDDRFGASGTSDTTNDSNATTPAKGNWSGMFFGPLSVGSIDHALVAFAGGTSSIEGGFGEFDPVEIIQAQVRIANSTFDRNQLTGGGERNGRGPSDGAAIFIRGAQPVILNNVFKNNFGSPDDGVFVPNAGHSGAVISINVNALNSVLIDDWGRSRGRVDFQGSFGKNSGPLIRNNLIGNNSVNGMVVRGGTITTNVVWDDTDIVHVVMSAIQVPNQQSLSGTMRLESSAAESLVVKLLGTNTDLIGSGEALDMTDRTGGTLQLVGTPNHPVVLASLKDDSVGAGLTPEGRPQTDTLNRKGVVAPAPPNLANQGPIILYSAPLDEHGVFLSPPGDNFDGWDTLESLVRYVRGASTVQNPLADVLAVGLHDLPILGRTYSQVAIENVTQQLGLSLAWVDTGSEIGNVDFNDFGMVYIPSDAQTPLPTPLVQAFEDIVLFGGITNFQLDALAGRTDDLVNYVNQGGGGLLALSQNTAAEPYKWLDVPDHLIINKSGGNVLTQTAQAPPEWLRTDGGFRLGLPWLYAFEGTAGFNRLEPWLVDPVTGEIAMLGLAPGGPGLGPPRDIATPGDWGSVRLDVLSNDRNVDVINEIEQGFTASGDANQLPSTAQFLGELAKDQVSGDDNVRLGFEIHGGLSQAANSPGGADVDVYSFRGTAGTRVWIDIDRTASSLDSVVELVDANGAVIAGSDNSIAESSGTQATVGIARPMESGAIPGLPSPFATRDFYTSNPKDAGLRANLPGTPGTVNTYFVRVRSASTNLSNLTGGITKGAYVLQVRLQEKDEFAGSTVRYADIRFATSGIEVIGKPERSPLMSYSGELARGQNEFNQDLISTFATAQNLGNLLTSDRRAINVAGNLRNSAEVDWYKFELNYEQVQKIGGLSDFLTTFAGMIRINYADGLVRPDTTLSLFDEQGRLLMVGRDSQLVDALPRPNTGGDNANLSHGSYGQLDPTIGPVHIPAGTPITVDQFGNREGVVTYYVAVSSAALLPQDLAASYTNLPSNPFVRLEPSDGIDRISEDHFGTDNFSTANPPQQLFPALPGDDINRLNTHADSLQLGDVVLFVDTWIQTEPDTGNSFLRMVNPFTGTVMNTPNNAPLLELPTSDQPLGFFNIAMRNDGRLFALTQGDTDRSSGNYVEVNTASGDIVNAIPNTPLDDMLDTYRLGPGTDVTAIPPVIEWNASSRGVQWQALAYLQGDSTTSRRLFAIGNRAADDQGAGGNATVPQRTNLLFELNPDTGEVLDRPTPPQAVYSETLPLGSGTDAVPIGNFSQGPNLIADPVTGMAIIGDDMYFITTRGDFYLIENWAGPTASNNPYHLGLRGETVGGLPSEKLPNNNDRPIAEDARENFGFQQNSNVYHLGLTGDISAGSLPAEFEPNDTTANNAAANFLQPPNINNLYQLGLKGSITIAGDTDYYNIGELQQGDVITISQSGSFSSRGSNPDTLVQLHRLSGGLVASNDDGGPPSAIGGDSLIFRFTVPATDTYFINAGSFGDLTGTYDLGVVLETSLEAPATGGAVTTETEPNNTIATATDVSTSWRQTQYLSQTSGTISSSGDIDRFSYQFTAGDLITVNIESTSGLEARVRLRGSNLQVIAQEDGSSDGPGGASPIYSFIIPTTGTYVVEVLAASGTGAYNALVYLSTTTPPPPADVADFYKIGPLQAGDQITVAMSGIGSMRGANANPHLELWRDNTNNPIMVPGVVDDNGGSGNDAEFSFTVVQADTYYVRASSAIAPPADRAGDYDLSVFLTNAGTAPNTGGPKPMESGMTNDTASQADDVSDGWRQINYLSQTTGAITSGDVDFYAYEFNAGDLVTVDIVSTMGLDAQVRLWDATGPMPIALNIGDNVANGASIYSFYIPNQGTYFVDVRPVGAPLGTYRADVYLTTDTPPPMPPPDPDFFAIGQLQEGDTITITMSGADSNRSGVNALDDPVVELHRGNSAAPVALDPTGDSGPGSDSLIYRYTVPAGIPVDDYFIRAAGQNNALGSYQLGVWLDNAGDAPLTGVSVTTETEPNNQKVGTFSNVATSWRQTRYLSQTTGQITTGDRDFFEYTFTPGDLVTINIDADPNSTLEAQVKLYDSNGNMVIASEDGTSRPGDSSIYAFIIPQGTRRPYFVEVSAESGTGNYTAQVYLSTLNAAGILGNSLPAETETNNTIPTADDASTNFADLASSAVRATRLNRILPTAGTTMTGLARGPLHVEAGAYANTLFAIDTDGRLFAIDRSGNPAPIFTDGRTSISTGITNAQGLAFSSLDYNLWHVTVTRATDAGHGIVESFDNNITRDPGGGMPFQYLIGGASFYFGLEPVPPPNPVVRIDAQPGARAYDTNPDLFSTYQLPGGALGSLTSNTFSLEGYTSGDQPALYFNYLLETSDVNSTSNMALDAMRVLVSADGANWELLATNNVVLGSPGAENPVVLSPTGGLYNGLTAKQKVQGLFEPDQPALTESLWRQARVDLADFAGKSNLRLRFQFSTAGTMGSGSSTSGTGRILQALPGSDLRDGQTFRIDSTTFTFRSGFALNVAAGGGALIADGETITINGTPFEFKKMGVPTATQILITDDLSAEEVAQRIASVLSQPQFSLIVRRFGSRIEVSNALTMSSASSAVIVQGAPVPAAPAATDIVINGDMSSTQVAVAIATALDRVFTVGTNDGLIFTTSKLSGDQLRIFGHTITSSGPLPSFSGTLPGDSYGRFNDPSRNRHRGPNDILDPALEGVYIDDIIIGFASRGEIVTNAVPGDIGFTPLPLIPGAPTRILAGDYQLQMGPSDSYAFPLLDLSGHIALTTSFDVNDRFARGFTLVAPPASQIVDGQTFTIDDGYNPLVFEFDMNGSLTNSNHVRVTVANGATEAGVAVAIRDAINLAAVNRSFKVRAGTAINGNRVDLFDALQVKGNALEAEGGSLGRLLFGAPGAVTHTGLGDVSGIFGQFEVGNAAGQTLILGNQVSDSRQVGIQVVPKIGQIIDPKAWFTVLGVFPVGFPEVAGSAANLPVLNSRQWIPGVTLKNNLVVESGRTAIQVGGSPNATFSYAQNEAETEIVWDPVLGLVDELEVGLRDVPHYQPFVRVVNNTVYGAKNGIAAVNASTPTIINNIIVNTGVALTALIRIRAAAINVDKSSAGGKGDTVIGANLYQNNVFNALGTGDSNAILLTPAQPLFVDAANRNFYLKEHSLAIDSSVNSVQERTALLSATLPLGMPQSPIQAPETDLLGQLRVDDPFVPTPPGLGSNVFKDRGAVERADFVGPTAALVNPIDNDPNRIDRNPLPNHLLLVNALLTDFSIQLLDGVGAGIDDSTVLPTASAEKFTIRRTIGGTTTTLTRNVDYVLAYDTNSKIVKLIPSQGIWLNATYTISLDNSMASGIKDLANNLLQPNEPPNTQFVIELTDQIVSPWQNPDNKYDVSGNGLVSGFDLLLIVNRLLTGQIGVLPEVAVVPPYLDISGDGRLTAIDALQLINFILSTGTPRSESAPPVTTTTLDADLPSAAPAAAASSSNSVAVGLAMSQEDNRVEAEAEPWWAPSDGSPDAVTAQSVAAATLPMEKARQAGALAATMEPDEFDTLNSELDSILTELAGDLRRRVLV